MPPETDMGPNYAQKIRAGRVPTIIPEPIKKHATIPEMELGF